MLVKSARIEMIWEDGRKVELGTVGIDTNKEISLHLKHLRQKVGWELVRAGFMAMIPWGKWRLDVYDTH